MKRIILFISSLQKGGSERVMVNLAEYFHEKKYDVVLVTQYKRECLRAEESAISVSGTRRLGASGKRISRMWFCRFWEKIT